MNGCEKLHECSVILESILGELETATKNSVRLSRALAVQKKFKLKPKASIRGEASVTSNSPDVNVHRTLHALQEEQQPLAIQLREKQEALQLRHQPVGGPVRRWQSERIRQLKEEIARL